MSDTILGQTLKTDDTTITRDAIHIAVAPVIAGENLQPGQHVGFLPETSNTVGVGSLLTKHIGIVDPYLKQAITKGQRFYIFLYPRTVTSLKHVWTHPDFDNEEMQAIANDAEQKFSAAKKYIEYFANVVGLNINVVFQAARKFVNDGDYFVLNNDTPDICYDETEMKKFWSAYTTITKEVVVEEKRTHFFRCAC